MSNRLLCTVLLSLLPAFAQAGPVEDAFRGLIERLKAGGTVLPIRPLPGMGTEITKPVIGPRADTLELGRDQYAIFVTPWCRTCDVAVKRLKQRGFEVEVLDITTNAVARDAFNLSGAKGVPSILAGKQMLGGWSDKHFDRLLKDDIQQKIQEQRGTGG